MINGLQKIGNHTRDAMCGVIVFPEQIGMSANHAIRTISGIVATAFSVLTLGKIKEFNDLTYSTLYSQYILSDIYCGIAQVFNKKSIEKFNQANKSKGVLRNKFDFFGLAQRCAKAELKTDSANIFIKRVVKCMNDYKQVSGRILYALAAIISTIARVADLILGLIAVTGSIIYLFQHNDKNIIAARQLSIFGVIHDLAIGLRGFINPYQSHLHRNENY